MASLGIAPPDVKDVTLSLFGGRKTDIAPSDLPEGLTPDEQDGIYLPGQWQSRPGLGRLYAAGVLTAGASVLYEKTYVQPGDLPFTLVLTSDGQLWKEDVSSGNPPIAIAATSITPGLYAQSVSEFGREYIAFSDLLHGQGVPLQYDGTNLDRVTMDGPGAPPTVADAFANLNLNLAAPYALNTITAASESGGTVTLTTAFAIGLKPGQTIMVAGVTPTGYNGTFTVLTTPTATTLTYLNPATGLGVGTIFGIVALPVMICQLAGLADAVATGARVGDWLSVAGNGNTGLNNNAAGNPAQWQVVQVGSAGSLTLATYEIAISIAPIPAANLLTITGSQGGGSISIGGQSSLGGHQVVVMWLTRQGYLSKPSPAGQFVSVGNSKWTATNLPIGPSNVVARVLGFTGAGGDNFFIIPASVTLPNPSSLASSPIAIQSTIVPDNVSSSYTFDIPDNTLFAALAIDQIGNDLFDQVVIGPVLGFFAYASRLACWGDYNKVENFLNMGFEGGYLSGVLAAPKGWDASRNAGGKLINGGAWAAGMAWQVTGGPLVTNIVSITSEGILKIVTVGNSVGFQVGITVTITGNSNPALNGQVTVAGVGANLFTFLQVGNNGGVGGTATAAAPANGVLSQSAYQDSFGAPILSPLTQYSIRFWAQPGAANLAGNISATLTGTAFTATATIPVNSVPIAGGFTPFAQFNAATPASVPADLVLSIFISGLPNGARCVLDECELIFTENPYRDNLSRWSYVNNPEAFAQTTGQLGPEDDDSPIRCFALLRQSSLLESADGIHIFQDNTGEPGTWNVNQLTRAIGAVSVKAGDPGKFGTGDAAEDWALVAGKNGVYLFAGAEFWKVSQEISRNPGQTRAQDPRACWDDINWGAEQTIVAKNDPASRRAYFAVPLNGATTPNKIFVLDYREMDTATQIASAAPLHITLQGKMRSSDLTRKWSVWNVAANDIEVLIRPGNQRTLGFAGGLNPQGLAFGNLYTLDPGKLTDDDYGAFTPYYTTYFFTDHETEQALGIGSDIHLARRLHGFIAGVGLVYITPIVDSLYNFQPPLSPRVLTKDTDGSNFLKSDLEWTMVGIRGQRIAFRISVAPLPGSSDVQLRLQKFVVGMMKDPVVAVRQSAV